MSTRDWADEKAEKVLRSVYFSPDMQAGAESLRAAIADTLRTQLAAENKRAEEAEKIAREETRLRLQVSEWNRSNELRATTAESHARTLAEECKRLKEALEMLRGEWKPQCVVNTPVDLAVVKAILILADHKKSDALGLVEKYTQGGSQ